jgi:outer membrane lipoprotein SlyB
VKYVKKTLALVVALIFALGIAAVSFAGEMMGTVMKVDGAKMTIKDDKGKETMVEDKMAKDIKVGDKVMVKDGKVTKAAEKPKKKKIEGC